MDNLKAKKQAKVILDKFVKALEKVKTNEDFYVEREEFEREESKGGKVGSASLDAENHDENFKADFLENAPKKDKNFVIAEKGGWK